MTKSEYIGNIDTLVILPCHSIYKRVPTNDTISRKELSQDEPGPGFDEKDWELAPFQYEAHDHLFFIKHIYASYEYLLQHKANSVLVLSGGYTKDSQKELSESLSYLNVAKMRGLIPLDYENTFENGKLLLEDRARDSYENVVFSLIKFRELIDKYPKKIVIVGLEFKRFRFIEQHLKVLQFPVTDIEYIGIGPEYPENIENLPLEKYQERKDFYFKDLEESEEKFARSPFSKFWFGEVGSGLYTKKSKRDPFDLGFKNYEDVVNTKNQIKGDSAMLSLMKCSELSTEEARSLYDQECKDKFAWF
ncbi:unnamed protein product [[Candida] boidinii]|uniref:Unnamed protein product n=1 Tax=Candida boidinii TaxID=5477 RepID=A0A9W6SVQ4_CANBO|nr:hypothetical protein B5S30_g3608 [[Candida] boidinii]OWB81587.1 hypothetical protein B5S33_g206 [[Candida] boidinii]GME68044.1 unnamed protein product [[Candida] boidinii]GMF06966.1 unnamed protein product [[Candida] boidinii]GMG20144.1 unnamed protein product [[Candida] boidinii]